MQCVFENDNNVKINLPDDANASCLLDFPKRNKHEIIFRRIHSFLIKNNIIKNNIIDLGCWVGDNSIPWAMQIPGTVYAIDPSEDNVNFINQVCELNNVKNVKTILKAISNKKETLYSEIKTNHYTLSSFNVGQHKFEAVSLDYLHETNQIENISLIHLDVEGMEAKVVEGSERIIETYRPIVSFEQHVAREPYMEIVNSFIQNNYEVYLINESLPGCLPDCRNFIAFPMELGIDINKICTERDYVYLISAQEIGVFHNQHKWL
jgi:FkbM family methyltransferase